MDEKPTPKISTVGYATSCFILLACIVQVSLAPKAASGGGETSEETISKQAEMLVEQVPAPFNIKVGLRFFLVSFLQRGGSSGIPVLPR